MSDRRPLGSFGEWRSSGLEARVLSGLSRSLESTGRDDMLFRFARAHRLVARNAAENARPQSSLGCSSPLELLDLALRRAVEAHLVPEMAEFLLLRARWADQLSSQTPLDAARVGAHDRALTLAGTGDDQRANLWYLLLAWEYADTGNVGQARDTLRKLLVDRPRPRLASIRVSDWAGTLLRRTIDVDRAMFLELQTMLEDNSRLEFGRELIRAGELDLAIAVAQGMQVFASYKAKILAAVAKAQAAVGDMAAAGHAAALALQAVDEIRDDENWLAEYLAEVACAQALGGDIAHAEATFARATRRALASDRRAQGLAAVAVGQAEAGLPDAAAETIRLLEHTDPRRMSNEDDHGEALEAYALARVPDDIEAAVAALRRTSPTYTYRSRTVSAVCERIVRSGRADLAVTVIQDLLTERARDRALAAVVRALAETGGWSRALTLVGEMCDPGLRADTLLDLVGLAPPSVAEAFVDTLSGERIRAAIAEIASDEDRAGTLARYAVTRPHEVRTQLLDDALRIACDIDHPDQRWRAIAEIAAIQADHGIDSAPATFAAARAILDEDERGSDWDGNRLWQLGTIQAEHGDASGARETFALVLRGPSEDSVGRLTAMSLIGIGVTQARAGDQAAARQTASIAMRSTRGLSTQEQAALEPFAVRTLVEAGDVTAAVGVIYAALARIDEDEEDEDLVTAAMAAASAAGPVALRLFADCDERLAWDLLSDVSGQVRPLLAGHLAPAESLVELARAQAEVGDIAGALTTVAGSDYNRVICPAMAAVAAAQARRGELDQAEKTVADIGSSEWQVEARCAVATEMSARGNSHAVAQLLQQASMAVSAWAKDAARLLVKVAETQAALDQLTAARDTLLAARAAAARIDTAWTRATTECRIARAQAKVGDFDNAWRTAEAIEQPDSAGEAMFHTTAYQSGAVTGAAALQVAVDGFGRITSPFWQAAGLVLLAAAKQKRGDADAPDISAQAHRLVANFPEGEAQAQFREVLADAALAMDDWEMASKWVREVTVDRAQRLLTLANAFAERGAAQAVTHLLPECAYQLDSAYLVLSALSVAYPEHAAAIAALVAATVPADAPEDTESTSPREHRDRWLAQHAAYEQGDDELDDDSEPDDDSKEWQPVPEEPLSDVELSDVVLRALHQATAELGPGRPLDTRAVMRWLMEADGADEWSRISLHFAEAAVLAAADTVDQAEQPGGQYDGTPLTGTCTRALRAAVRLAVEYDMWPMAPGILALGLVADPESAAARALGVVDRTTHDHLVTLILEDLLNTNLNDLDLSTDNDPEDDFPPSWPGGLSAGGECDPADHVLQPGTMRPDSRIGGMIFTVSCGRCGVGCSVRSRKIGSATVQTKLTIFPARSSYAISRHFIRRALFSYEEYNQEQEQAGFTVIRETPLIKGSPQGM